MKLLSDIKDAVVEWSWSDINADLQDRNEELCAEIKELKERIKILEQRNSELLEEYSKHFNLLRKR